MAKTIPAKIIHVPAKKVHGCHDCPNAEYRGGMSDTRGYYCLLQDNGWGTMINQEVREKKFNKGCPL